MRIFQAVTCLIALVAFAGVAQASEVAEIDGWKVTIPAGFKKVADSCEGGG